MASSLVALPAASAAVGTSHAALPASTAAAAAGCTPDAGYTDCVVFTYTGADQQFTVPNRVTSLNVKAWGAGSGGSGWPGGSGGYVQGSLAVTAGTQFSVMVGNGGGYDAALTTTVPNPCLATYGFGGACAPLRNGQNIYLDGGGGGGLSGLFTGTAPITATSQARALLVAGGGGGGEGANGCTPSPTTIYQSGGGAGGNSFSGGQPTMQGVNGLFNPATSCEANTGGGGGYAGGGGTTRLSSGVVGGANGGSNFIAPSVTGAVNQAGAEHMSAGTSAAPSASALQYIAGVGVGTQQALGGSGEVVIQYAVAPLPTVTCTTDPAVFNTGYDATTGAQLANGAVDQRWTVAGGIDGLNHGTSTTAPAGPSPAALPPGGTTFAPAYAGAVNTLWASSQSGKSQWISANYVPPANGMNQSTGYGDWYYRYQFNLDPAVDPSSFQLDMSWLADNSVAGVWVNSVAQTGANLPQSPNTPYVGAGFVAGAAATTSLAGSWQSGLNTIIVQVKSLYPAEGFNAEVRSTALCPKPSYTVSKSASATSVRPGGTITYTVTVANTGGVAYTAAQPASFTDNLAGVLDDAVYNGDASDGATVTGNTLSWSGPLAVGATKTITYSVTVRTPDNGDHVLRNAVVPGTGGSCAVPGDCATTTPVQSFSVTKTVDTNQVIPGNAITYTVTVTNTGQADFTAADPASWSDDLTAVLDDATYNNDVTGGATYAAPTLSWSGPLAIGATATFTYSVTVNSPDTGDRKLHNAVVTGNGGTCPAGSTDPACFVDIPSGSYTVAKTASATTVLPGDTITYTVRVTNTGDVAYTAAEPAAFTDDLSGVLDDASYNGDASHGATVTGTNLSWSGALAVGQTITVTYSVTVDRPDTGDKSVKNTVRATTGGGACDPAGACTTTTPVRTFTVAKSSSPAGNVHPGDTVTYTVTVTNTGTGAFTAANPASFTDDLSKILDDARYNGDATGGATVTGNVLSWSGALAVGATITVTYSVTVKNPSTGDKVLTNAVVPGDGGSCATTGGCTTTNDIASFTVSKTASPTGSVSPGDTVTYTVTVTNTGSAAYTAASPASFTDDLSRVLDDASYNGDANNGATYTAPNLTWSGPLGVGQTTTVTYSVTVGAAGSGDGTLTNAVTPAPGTGGGCDPSATCTTSNPLKAFSLTKAASSTTVRPGDVITYTITATNTGRTAYTAASPARFADNLTAVLDDATYNGDATDGATYTAPTLAWALAIPVGGSVTVSYSVRVNDPDTGDHTLSNAVVPSGPDGSCAPGACTTTTPVQSFSVAKSADTNTVIPGGVITYTITVTNTGTAAYTAANPASWTDDLTQVLDDATYNGDATGGVAYAAPTLSWSGPLSVGASQTFTYSVTVNDPATGDRKLHNAVVTPPDGGCAAGSTDPACSVDIPSGSYSVAKTASSTTAAAGDIVTYTVTVKNTGDVAYTAAKPASFTDDLSSVLDDATYNGDASNGAVFAAPNLTWSGPLAVGQTVTVVYSVRVNDPDTGDKTLANAVRPTGRGGACDPAAQCTTTTEVQSFTVAKASSATTAAPGDVITYTITVTNTGRAAFTAAKPAAFTDDLSSVLDDATYNGDASNGATYSAPKLAWAVALPVGGTITATYSVTVNSPDTGDHELKNTVVPGTGGECDPAASCSTSDPVAGFTVKKTVDTANAMPGATVTYTITVTNTGKVDYTTAHPASFTDDLSRVLDDATYNDDATGGATYAKPVLSWSGPLTVGSTTTVSYSVKVTSPDTGDQLLANAVVTPSGGNCAVGADVAGCAVKTTIGDPPAAAGLADTGSTLAIPAIIVSALLALGGAAMVFVSRRRRASTKR
ncbi:Ig-like domain-containing protein [Leifsonia sp. TF02-11]|uniref:DUF7927 domain-containing protein n=1 Tax=Leifsonia sp. TF02-11 TaxID=2815212 RepID=UPI001AA1609A|nr:Ig-like domain-containing protein [Leifsonia sp. TF02-11]MBO1741425.1 DUF11 domain-containing protein [Leifsonia sp. TF02-11]